jgi:hypothetical protein
MSESPSREGSDPPELQVARGHLLDINNLDPGLTVEKGDEVREADFHALRHVRRIEDDLINAMDKHSVRSTSANWFREIYNRRNHYKAANTLLKRLSVEISTFLLPESASEDGDIIWQAPVHYLDAACAVSKNIGLGAILPGGLNDHTFALTLKPQDLGKVFKNKHAQLGFDYAHRALYLGYSNHREAWIFFRPNQDQVGPYPAGVSSGPSALSTKNALKFWLFLWDIMKGMALGLTCTDVYVDVMNNLELDRCSNVRYAILPLSLLLMLIFYPDCIKDYNSRTPKPSNSTMLFGTNTKIGSPATPTSTNTPSFRNIHPSQSHLGMEMIPKYAAKRVSC